MLSARHVSARSVASGRGVADGAFEAAWQALGTGAVDLVVSERLMMMDWLAGLPEVRPLMHSCTTWLLRCPCWLIELIMGLGCKAGCLLHSMACCIVMSCAGSLQMQAEHLLSEGSTLCTQLNPALRLPLMQGCSGLAVANIGGGPGLDFGIALRRSTPPELVSALNAALMELQVRRVNGAGAARAFSLSMPMCWYTESTKLYHTYCTAPYCNTWCSTKYCSSHFELPCLDLLHLVCAVQ